MTIPALSVLSAAMVLLAASPGLAQTQWPNQRAGDFVIKDFRFASGETIAELKLHYVTLGTEKRNAAGDIVNGVVLLHGPSGSGTDWLRPSIADALFMPVRPST